MSGDIKISNIQFKPSGNKETESGICGWVSCTVDDRFHLDGIVVRRIRDGRMTLTFPASRDRYGNQHFIVRPLTNDIRRTIEQQIFQALGLQGGVA
ncbi:MAG: septation protein SpoVG family protein [Planctomycetes bacterium]|nr:septation protein SpoVG family protein [Planctomycetota bacterium]